MKHSVNKQARVCHFMSSFKEWIWITLKRLFLIILFIKVGIPIPITDKLSWKFANDGQCSVKTTTWKNNDIINLILNLNFLIVFGL